MAAQIDNEQVNDHVYEDGAPGLSGQRVLPPVPATQIDRGVCSDVQQIVVPSLF